MEHVEGTFEVTSWSEDQVDGLEDTVKVTRATIGQRFSGGLEAETIADMVMTYRDDGTADFVGYQRVQGRIGGRTGNFVLRSVGGYDGSEASSKLEVVSGSAQGELAGLAGTGTSAAPLGSTGTFSFDFDR
jgi:hypothetical protein